MLGIGMSLPQYAVRNRTPQGVDSAVLNIIRQAGGTLLMVPDAYTGVFEDSTGLIPVDALGDPIGLITDRSYGAGNLGGELFTGVYAPGVSTTATYNGNAATATFGGPLAATSSNWLSIPGETTANGMTVVEFWATWVSGGDLQVGRAWTVGQTITAASNGGVRKKYSAQAFSTFTVPAAGRVTFGATVAGSVWIIELVTVREVLGNHATQPTTASKPIVGRVPKRVGPEMIPSQDLTTWTSGGAFGNWLGSTATSTTVTAIGTNGSRYVRLPCTPGKTYTLGGLVTAGTGTGAIAIAYGTSANVFVSEQTSPFITAGGLRVTTTAPANAAFVEFAVRVNGSGTTSTFTNLAAAEALELTTAITFDGSNDFLTAGTITTGNEGWLCAGVTFGGAAGVNETVFANGAGSAALKGVWFSRNANATSLRFNIGNGTALTQPVSNTLNLLNTPRVVEGGWTASTVFAAVDGIEASLARTGDATPAPNTPLIGTYASALHPLNGPMTAFIYCPVLPSPADRALIRKWVGSLQGQTL